MRGESFVGKAADFKSIEAFRKDGSTWHTREELNGLSAPLWPSFDCFQHSPFGGIWLLPANDVVHVPQSEASRLSWLLVRHQVISPSLCLMSLFSPAEIQVFPYLSLSNYSSVCFLFRWKSTDLSSFEDYMNDHQPSARSTYSLGFCALLSCAAVN